MLRKTCLTLTFVLLGTACLHDFDDFDPIASSDGGVVSGSGDGGSSGGGPTDAADEASPVSCVQKSACFDQATTCQATCAAARKTCETDCAGSNGCKAQCRSAERDCVAGCLATCRTCAGVDCQGNCP